MPRFVTLTVLAVSILCSVTSLGLAKSLTIYVSPNGSDDNAGTLESPLLSLNAAQARIRSNSSQGPVEVVVADGVYYLPETLIFRAADSGGPDVPITYRAENEGQAVISGGSRLKLDWQPAPEVGKGVFRATTPAGLRMDQLFVNGERQRMARYPNYNPALKTAAYQGFASDAFSKERAARWADPSGGYIHAMHRSRWGGYHYRITGKDADGEVTYEGGWQNNRQMGMHRDFRMVENIFEELDAPGEWYHDSAARNLYFIPGDPNELDSARIEVVRLKHLIEFQGSPHAPVQHIQLRGFTFRHTARTFMETKEPLLRSDWTIYRGGAILLTGTENVSILDGTFDQMGGNAIFVNNYNRGALIRGCHIRDAGASGVVFVGDPEAVRDPLFEYAETQDLGEISLIPGPKTDNYPADSVVEDCLIHGIGRVERQPAGVQISMARRITVRDTSIYDCARAGINISEGTWGGHLIEGCDVFDTVLETHDHGSFNSWGRDRYWNRAHRKVTEPAVEANPRLPYLDAVETTIIRNSRWRCDHGWDIDLDDGSSNYEIYNNLMLAGGLKLREGYGRLAYNNIHINNGLHPHVWFANSGDRFTRNIVMASHRPIRNADDWGRASAVNHFAFKADLKKAWEQGADPRSTHGDPAFVDPASGDFRVRPESPALEVGFKNFPMDQFGVKKPSLRAIARTPIIPDLQLKNSAEQAEAAGLPIWREAALRGLQGEAFSAFGVSKEDGGIQIIPLKSRALAIRQGLQADDLIQQVNGQKVRTPESMLQAVEDAGSNPIRLGLVRNQQFIEITLE